MATSPVFDIPGIDASVRTHIEMHKEDRTMKRLHILSCLAGLAALLGLSSNAAAATTSPVGIYELHNHPDGAERTPFYGLRLDGLLGYDIYTFDFDHPDSDMILTYDGDRIVIEGQAFGGADIGDIYDPETTDIWDILFVYDVGLSESNDAGFNDLVVDANDANFGTLVSSFGRFTLEDKADTSGMSFRFGDKSGGGHRGFDGISGWGWLNHGTNCIQGDCSHVVASDWLFTATVVPVPAAVWLFGSGLLAIVGMARRRH